MTAGQRLLRSRGLYPDGVPISSRLRRHLPILASVVVVIVCLASAGTTCACVVSHHPTQTIGQLSATPLALPTSPDPTWTFALVAVLFGLIGVTSRRHSFGRASPEMLQRFRF
jgi:hypothetical protein